jgi:hypothetical protein
LIVSPDGSIDACYLLKKDWSRNGLNMRFGRLNVPGITQPAATTCGTSVANGRTVQIIPLNQIGLASKSAEPAPQSILEIDYKALEGVRSLNVNNRPLCANCMCRYNCAGGCHVNHNTSAVPGNFDSLCIHTRLIIIANLLKQMGQHDLVTEWLSDRTAMEASVWQMTDRIMSPELLL